jgi:hypothetical protein
LHEKIIPLAEATGWSQKIRRTVIYIARQGKRKARVKLIALKLESTSMIYMIKDWKL